MADDNGPKGSAPEETIETVTESGKPVERRIQTPTAAYNVFMKMKRSNESLAAQRAMIQGQLDGNAPYSRSERQRLGLSWMSNVNFGKARSTIRLNATSIWNMFTSVMSLVNLVLKNPDDDGKHEPSTDYGAIVASEFTRTLLSDEDFYHSLMFRLNELASHGIGAVYWPDEIDWRSEPVKVGSLLFPAKTKSKKTSQKTFCIRSEMDPIDLFNMIGNGEKEEEDVIKEDGFWDIKECQRLLIQAYGKGGGQADNGETHAVSNWEDAQTRLKNHEYTYDAEFEGLRIVHMFTEEIGGGISHLIFAETDPTQANESGSNKIVERKFMYDHPTQYGNMSEAIHLLLFDIGNGTLAGVRGLGYEIFHTSDVANRTLNTAVDGSVMGSSLVVQPQSGQDAAKLAVTKIGPVVSVPAELNMIQSSFMPQTDKALQVLELMASTENSNAGVFQTRSSGMQSRERTAYEVETEQTNEARFEGNQSAWYYAQWESWLKETFRRILNKEYPKDYEGWKAVDEFKKACISRGVPKELLDFERWNLTATKAIGLGSPVLAQKKIQWLLGLLPQLPSEEGRRNAITDAVQVHLGPDKVARYLPTESLAETASNQHSLAALETNDLREGQRCLVGADNYHAIHLSVHFAAAFTDVKAMQEDPANVNLQQLVGFLGGVLQHNSEHLQFLDMDVTQKQKLEQFAQLQQQLAQVYQQLAAQLEQLMAEQQKAAEENAQIVQDAKSMVESREHELEMEKIRSNERVEMSKAESLDRSRMAKTETSINAQFMKLEADIRAKMMATIADIENKAIAASKGN